MTSYTVAATIAVLIAILADLFVLRTALVRSRTWWTAYGIVVFFQLLTNGWLTGRGIVRYSDDAILGSERIVFLGDGRIAYAPVEDLAFGFALVLMSCAAWVWTGARTRPPRGR
ncbi:MAG: lycopene cyclase domain-containing protein [Chloroflexota bacterium]|nr:lycopene cyclase domain-containing protein [Chloroflexota bacterium]